MADSTNVKRISKGINQDSSVVDQPKGTARFVLNGVDETRDGNVNFIANELGNEVCAALPTGYTPIGKEYIGNGQTAILLVKDDETASEIGILNRDCSYTTHMNDLDVDEQLNFTLANQIDVTYRLRRGCERNIYFTDEGSPPRYFNFDKPGNFKTAGNWNSDKFKLSKTSKTIPIFDTIDITEDGLLPPGSYNFALQYLDEDLNPTEWTAVSDTVVIYNDSTKKNFSEIRGSTGKRTFYQDFGVTNKAIRLTFGNLNTEYPFYRIGIIQATTGFGTINKVRFSIEISTETNVYSYSGEASTLEGTEEEIQQVTAIIEGASHIEQIENRLVLSQTKGKQINFCKLQKYASKIKADLVYKQVILNNIDAVNNQKRGQLHNEALGYMPGEIYSFGIIWKFDDGSLSPAYHIPGKAVGATSDMSDDNELVNTYYTDNSACLDYWGEDSETTPITNATKVRHHRFPSRGTVSKPLVTKSAFGLEGDLTQTNKLYLYIANLFPYSILIQDVSYKIYFKFDGTPQTPYEATIPAGTLFAQSDILVDQQSVAGVYSDIVIKEIVDLVETDPGTYHLVYTPSVRSATSVSEDANYVSDIFGIQFSNIDIPDIADTNGQIIDGYYIVRHNRTDDTRTILDSGILTPLLIEKAGGNGTEKFVSHGHLLPNAVARIKDDTFALIHPEFKFRGKEYKNTTEIVQEGEYTVTSKDYSTLYTQDVMPGTSYDSAVSKKREKDTDGFTLHNYIRNNNVSYGVVTPAVLASGAEIKEIFYLDTLFSKSINEAATNGGDRKEIFNVSGDNKIGIVSLDKTLDVSQAVTKIPYVMLKRTLADPYSGFRSLVYYKEHNNLMTGTTSDEIYNGDSYISPMRYVSSMFYDIRLKKRGTRSGFFNIILGVLLVAAAVVVTVITLGAGSPITAPLIATGLSLAAAGLGISQIASGLRKEQLGRVYGELYEQGLKDTVEDTDTEAEFLDNPEDDEVQWFQDSISDLWFESSVNMNWRMGSTLGLTDFMNPLAGFSTSEFTSYALDKVTILDSEADGGRNYQGHAKAEIYEINEDYRRRGAQKFHFHLGIEYDCCSACNEDFPHRNHYSEQSFQEELTDNYRVFLPNNYRDIEGETGKITDTFRIKDNLYIHTEEALWHLPQTFQERITDEVVSFIGTGEFFSIPPRKILDDDTGHSGGNKHKWGAIKTPYGVFFVCESQNTIYQFDGKKLSAISNKDLNSWFKNNIGLNTPGITPSSTTGFVSAYDSRFKRILFTKKDELAGKDKSWTISFSLKKGEWRSWHSYLPNFYINTPDKLYSWIKGNVNIWKHNADNIYHTFYGVYHPHIIEYVSLSNPLLTRIWDGMKLQTEALKFDAVTQQFYEQRFVTFNKLVVYNSRQCSGELILKVKDTQAIPKNYLKQQIVQTDGAIMLDRNEKDWTLNDLRDIRVDYDLPIWRADDVSLASTYFIDKVLNTVALDVTKEWHQLESFRDKYLIIRLIFDNLADVKLITNYSAESETPSFR